MYNKNNIISDIALSGLAHSFGERNIGVDLSDGVPDHDGD